ncbi:hypothetical protein [Klebsiella sp. WP4-W18-ESBL-05]|uniref:hypothetical protein n=1 Tax=Klebsiella sp. WP4-W18-ESBL-05 TaxID=2675713 RepID=UPI0015DC63CB|nr:hypothetical protein [Klebsiella sp. WP4-W18-ESBL-05]BBR58913.1 hypothetical protein WP4W18E05_22810 [Klebsiella sp. WP4-W18-ESBL-05]
MEQFTKEQLIAQAREDADTWRDAAEHFSAHPAQRQYAAVRLRVAEIALTVLTAPDIEPIYQYRIRNGYNGQVTEWQTIRRDHVDFVLKAQPHNAEFQIITVPPAPDGREQFEAWMLKKWGRERQEYDFVMGKFLHGDNYADSYTRHMWKAWTASRAAMINGNKHAQ